MNPKNIENGSEIFFEQQYRAIPTSASIEHFVIKSSRI